MTPNIDRAAEKAIETILRFDLDTRCPDPMAVLKLLPNVYLVSHDLPTQTIEANQDAVTLVNSTSDGLQFIVIYNAKIDPFKLRFALARELAHVILEHDGSSPADVWSAESACFAYHFLCPLSVRKPSINYRPIRFCISWEMKDMMTFGSVADMKKHIADERNRINRFIGKDDTCGADDIQLINRVDHDRTTGWKNCFDVVVDGKTIGYCGE